MRNWEYRLNERIQLEEGLIELEQSRTVELLRKFGLQDAGINYVLQHPHVLPIMDRAVCMVRTNPSLSLKEAFMKCMGMEQRSDDGYREDGSLPHGIRTWGNFVPVELPEVEIPFSDLPDTDRRQVDCFVLGRYRDRVSSSSHFYEHAISYERD